MNNSTYLTGALAFSFILFLAARGRLETYAAVLWGAVPKTDSGAQPAVGASPPITGATPTAKAAATPSTTSTFQQPYMPAGNGTAGLEFSDALKTAAGLAMDAGMFGF